MLKGCTWLRPAVKKRSAVGVFTPYFRICHTSRANSAANSPTWWRMQKVVSCCRWAVEMGRLYCRVSSSWKQTRVVTPAAFVSVGSACVHRFQSIGSTWDSRSSQNNASFRVSVVRRRRAYWDA